MLDVMVVLAENWKILLVGPLLIGLLALVSSYACLQNFVSNSILSPPASPQTPAQATVVMTSPLVLDRVIESLQIADGRSLQAARANLAKRISVSTGKDGLVRLDVTANTPMAAQTIANAIIDNWLITTVPQAQERVELEARLAYAKEALASIRRLLARLTSLGASDFNRTLASGESGIGVVALGELQARYFSEVLTIPRTLQGLSRAVVIQPPTLPTEPVNKRGLTVMLATLGGALTLLLWVFALDAWRKAGQNSQSAGKQARLLVALGVKGN